MGTRGPVPKPSDQRRRRNAPEQPIDNAPGADDVEMPASDPEWHAIAAAWYESLGQSGQSRYYEPSDWQTAYLIAESMSRDLSPQAVGIVAQGPRAGEVVVSTIPLKGASLAAYLKAMSVLLVTEGDRRRAALELQRGGEQSDPEKDRADATVTQLRSLRGGAADG